MSTGSSSLFRSSRYRTLARDVNGQRYVIHFRADRTDEALRQIGRWAGDPTLNFSWYDAAILSQQIRDVKVSNQQSGNQESGNA